MPTLDQTRSIATAPATRTPPTALRIAYLLSQYPAISHTFFLQEVLGLRARGLHIETASINATDRPLDQLPPIEAAEARTTQYIKGRSRPAALRDLLTTLVLHPAVLFRGLRAIASLRRITFRQRIFWLFYLAEAILVGRWMLRRNLHHLHVHFGGPVASVGMLTSIAWQVPYSLTIHGPEELLATQSYRLREKLAQASFVVCISDFCRSQLCLLTTPADWNKFTVVRLGVDPLVLTPSSRPPDNPSRASSARTLELVCTGRLVPAKGHHILLEALALLSSRGVHLHTTLIGAGRERERLEASALRLGLTPSITFTSALSHPETLAHLRKADLFVLASFAEGIPVALMEAMSLALPCVSTSIAGIPELIRTGLDGILVAPGNVEALADALEALAVDPALRRRLGASARQRILADYNLPLNQECLALSMETQILSTPARPPSQ